MRTIRTRLLTIGALLVLAVWQLIPTNVTQRVRDPVTGRMRTPRSGACRSILASISREGFTWRSKSTSRRAPCPTAPTPFSAPRKWCGRGSTSSAPASRSCRSRALPPHRRAAGEKDPARAKSIIQRTAFLEFRITDMKSLFRDALPEIDKALRRAGVTAPGQGAAAASVTQLFGSDTGKAKGKAKAQKGKAAKDTTDQNAPGALSSLLFQGQIPGSTSCPKSRCRWRRACWRVPTCSAHPRGIELKWGRRCCRAPAAATVALRREDRPIITGEYLQDAKATRDPLTNQSVVNFVLSRRGGRIFERETGRHVNDYMAIILDGRVQGQPPVIKSQIGQRGQIELGAKPLQDAQDLALVLKAGALPAPLTIIEERTIGPSLGQDSIKDGIRAGIVGVALVVLIMVGYYRLSGVLAVAALALYVVFTLAGLAASGSRSRCRGSPASRSRWASRWTRTC